MKNLTFPGLILSALTAIVIGCRHWEHAAPKAATREIPSGPASMPATDLHSLSYAKVFSRETGPRGTVIHVFKPWQGAKADFTYLLADASQAAAAVGAGGSAGTAKGPRTASDTLLVRVPITRAVTLTTTNLRPLESIGATDALVGLGGGKYVCSPEIRARLRSGRIRDIGDDMHLDLEGLLALKPDLLFTFVVGGSSDGGLGKLAETGIPVAIDGSYMEENPLGRAEWIKFTAAFFGKDREADSVFAVVDSSYHALADLAKRAAHRPTVVVGAPFGGVWWLPSGRTYVGRMLADAGADYAWASDTTRGSLNLDMEAVLGKAGDAEVWLNAGEWKDLADAKAKDPRNALFKPWKTGRIYTNDAVVCEGGGRDFYESGAARPDWILADLIFILHPELLPGHTLRWYRRLPGPV